MFWKLPEIAIKPDVLFTIPGINFPVTNTFLCTWIVIAVLLLLVYLGTRRKETIPRGFQNFAEWGVESLQNLVEGVSGKERGKKFFPLIATLFIFILFSNLIDILPGVDTIGQFSRDPEKAVSAGQFLGGGLFHFVWGSSTGAIIPWFRPPSSDLNLTFAMAIVVVIICQIVGFATLGAGEHLSKYFKFKELFTRPTGIIDFFVGLVELVTELSRILSFAFRLFGNIFAGGAVLAVFGYLTFIGNVVFIPLELFVAFVQALVFSLLTLVFLEMASTGHSHAEHEEEHLAEVEHEAAKQKLAASH